MLAPPGAAPLALARSPRAHGRSSTRPLGDVLRGGASVSEALLLIRPGELAAQSPADAASGAPGARSMLPPQALLAGVAPRRLACFAIAGAAVAAAGPVARQRRRRNRRQHSALAPRRANTLAWEGAEDSLQFASEAEYTEHLEKQSRLPAGFQVGSTRLEFVPAEIGGDPLPMDLSIIRLLEPTRAFAAVFTQNAFPGCPVLVGRRRLKAGNPLQAVVVNNKVANVLPAGDGERDSEMVCDAVALRLLLPGGPQSVLPCSTGVIGWRLPVQPMVVAVPEAINTRQGETILPFARGIMTTDRYPKVSTVELPGGARIVGVAKGAGMIEPNMATMLCFILTDAMLGCARSDLQELLEEAVQGSFNSISVDGDESTSDTCALISSSRVPCEDFDAFAAGLSSVCKDLAAQVVRNGEGTEHVIRVSVSGACDDAVARRVGRAVVNGPLFKAAVAGNDPNVGRLVGKVGQALGAAGASMAKGCVCRIGGEVIFEDGAFTLDTEKERLLSAYLREASQDCSLPYPTHNRVVGISVELGGGGTGAAVVLGSDLTKEYVAINADYRS